jgi:hypothetical protein
MNRNEHREMETLDEVRQWTAEQIYSAFGPWMETIVNQQKERLQLNLKTIWRNRRWYAFRDTGEQFEEDTMLIYFNPKKISKYSLSDLETIIDKLQNESRYSNPKRQRQ